MVKTFKEKSMNYCQNSHMNNNYYRANQPNSHIRLFHASPGTPAVDIYANGIPIMQGLAYKEYTQYLPVPAGNYNITVYPSGQTANPVLNTNLFIPQNTIFNITAIGTLPNISLYPIPEPVAAQNFGRACIRFINLSPNAPAVDVKFSNGTNVFNNVGFKDITNYACTPAGSYSFTVSPVGKDNTVLTVPTIKLDPNNYYTIYAVGQAGESPGLETILVQEPR